MTVKPHWGSDKAQICHSCQGFVWNPEKIRVISELLHVHLVVTALLFRAQHLLDLLVLKTGAVEHSIIPQFKLKTLSRLLVFSNFVLQT